MPARFEELDWRPTPMGELVLRRRFDLTFRREVYEIKLDDEFLMSSLFTVAEEEVARRSLAMLEETTGDDAGGAGVAAPRWDVLVGGLGLGYTAVTVLQDARVASLAVVDTLAEVIDWHRQGLIPAGRELTGDARCTLVHDDFFGIVRRGEGAEQGGPGRYHAVVVDIDHSPRHLLHPAHADLYTEQGARRLAAMLHPGGVFGLWSNDPPDEDYLATLRPALEDVRAEVVTFPNPLQGREATATLYLARRG